MQNLKVLWILNILWLPLITSVTSKIKADIHTKIFISADISYGCYILYLSDLNKMLYANFINGKGLMWKIRLQYLDK